MDLTILAKVFDISYREPNNFNLTNPENNSINNTLINWYVSNCNKLDLTTYENYDRTLVVDSGKENLLIYKIELEKDETGIVPHAYGLCINKNDNMLAEVWLRSLFILVLSEQFSSWTEKGICLQLDENYLSSLGSYSSISFTPNITNGKKIYYKWSNGNLVPESGISESAKKNIDLDVVATGSWLASENYNYGYLHIRNQSKIAYSLKGAFNRKNREAYVHRKLFHETSQGIIRRVIYLIRWDTFITICAASRRRRNGDYYALHYLRYTWTNYCF